jgi:hypothetical protein
LDCCRPACTPRCPTRRAVAPFQPLVVNRRGIASRLTPCCARPLKEPSKPPGGASVHCSITSGHTNAPAATIHKSQGSEYPAVVIPVMTQHNAPCSSGICSIPAHRDRDGLLLPHQHDQPLAARDRNVSGRRRWSKLGEWLGAANPSAGNSARHVESGWQIFLQHPQGARGFLASVVAGSPPQCDLTARASYALLSKGRRATPVQYHFWRRTTFGAGGLKSCDSDQCFQ